VRNIQIVGTNALVNALGTAGAIRFLMQADTGRGDYTKERDNILKGITMQDIVNDLGIE